MTLNHKPARRDADATRGALLDAAAQQFALHGFDGCRNQQIADAAGANKAMINYYFGGKLGLYRGVIADAMDRIEPLLDEYDADQGTNGGEALDRWLRTLDAVFRSVPHFPAILVREHLAGGKHLQEEFRSRISRFFQTTQDLLASHPKSLRAEDAQAVHLSIIGALTFYLVSEPYRQEAARRGISMAPDLGREAYVDYLVRLFVGGLGEHQQTEENP